MSASLYFEDYTVGRVFESPEPWKVDDERVRAFAGITGDKNRLHLDEEYAKASPFGGRIAHGLLGVALAAGIIHELGIIAESVVAFAALDWKFKGPIMVGDSVVMRMEVARTKPSGRGKGLVVLDARISTAEGRLVQRGTWSLWIKKKPEA